MECKLIAYTQPVGGGAPLDVCEKAASKCYDSKPTKAHRITTACVESGHESVLEHISFTFDISGVSRALLAQITRHRMSSFSVRSQRYCTEDDAEFIAPQNLMGDAAEIMCNFNKNVLETYCNLLKCGYKPEDARAVLPNATATTFVMTCNLRELIHICNLRLCSRAQKEIRDLVKMMRDEVVKVVPEADKWLVPSCEAHSPAYCPEHKGCGKHKTLQELIGE